MREMTNDPTALRLKRCERLVQGPGVIADVPARSLDGLKS